MSRQWSSSSRLLFLQLVCGTLAGVLPAVATGEVITVRSDGTGDFPSIQAAVDAAIDGDILQASGVFHETVVIPGKDLSLEGIGEAVLDANLQGTALRFESGSACEIRSLTIRRGLGEQYEVGGLDLRPGAEVTLTDCILEENASDLGSAVASVDAGSTLVLENCLVRENSGDTSYGIIGSAGSLTVSDCEVTQNQGATAILVFEGDARVVGNTIADNDAGRSWAGGIGVSGSGRVEVLGNVIRNCVGLTGGIAAEPVDGTNFVVAYNTLFGNRASSSGGQAHLTGVRGGEIHNNLLVGGDGYSLVLLDSNVSFSCNDVWSTEGVPLYHGDDLTRTSGNISVDPLFCDGDELCLSQASPCLAGNHPDGYECGTIGAREDCCDPTPVEERSWGQVKSLFRP